MYLQGNNVSKRDSHRKESKISHLWQYNNVTPSKVTRHSRLVGHVIASHPIY